MKSADTPESDAPVGALARVTRVINRFAHRGSALITAACVVAIVASAAWSAGPPARERHRARIGVLAHLSRQSGWENIDQLGAFVEASRQAGVAARVEFVGIDLGSDAATLQRALATAMSGRFALLLAPARSSELRSVLEYRRGPFDGGAQQSFCSVLAQTPILAVSASGSDLPGRHETKHPLEAACRPHAANLQYLAGDNVTQAERIEAWIHERNPARICACHDPHDADYAGDLAGLLGDDLALHEESQHRRPLLECRERAPGDCVGSDDPRQPDEAACDRLLVLISSSALAHRLELADFKGYDCVLVSDALASVPATLRRVSQPGTRLYAALPCGTTDAARCQLEHERSRWGPWGTAFSQWLRERLDRRRCARGGGSAEMLRRCLVQTDHASPAITYSVGRLPAITGMSAAERPMLLEPWAQ